MEASFSETIVGKSIGFIPKTTSSITDLKWNILNEDVSLPAAVLDLHKLNHNLKWMQNFADHYGIKLCPHGKTTMSPYLFHLQLKNGAWGISLASATQVKVAHSFKIPNVLMVNQLVGKVNMTIISDVLKMDPSFQFACLVESPQNVEQLGNFFRNRRQKLRVLLEMGLPGGRTGVRDLVQQDLVISQLEKFKDCLQLVGVEFYEAIAKSEEQVRQFVRQILQRTQTLADLGVFDEKTILISGAGSTYFDIVALELSSASIKDRNRKSELPIQLILRPGSYLTHEIGTYHSAKQRVQENLDLPSGRTAIGPEPMVTALQVWAYVQSLPEPGIAIIAMGKRDTDASFDCQFPRPCLHYRPDVFDKPAVAKSDWRVTYVMDQHSFMTIGVTDDVQVGDMISFEACYPATTLDKFKTFPLVDENYNVVNVLETYF